MAAVAGVGGALIVGAFAVPDASGWPDIATAVLVGFGTTVALAGFLPLLERRLTAVVETAVVQRVGSAVDERVQPVVDRLDTIEQQMGGLFDSMAENEDRIADQIVAGPGSLRDGLEEATRKGGIENACVWVEGRAAPTQCVLRFRLGHYTPDKPSTMYIADIIDVWGRFTPPNEDITAAETRRLAWVGLDTPDQIGYRLIKSLEGSPVWEGRNTFGWDIALRNLQRTIRVAFESRRRETGAWHLRGALYQLSGDDWAFTTVGLERRDKGLVLDRTYFEDNPTTEPPTRSDVQPVTETEWRSLLQRGRQLYNEDLLMTERWEPATPRD